MDDVQDGGLDITKTTSDESGEDPSILAAARATAEASKLRGNEKLKENTKSAAREALECFTAGLEAKCADAVLNAQIYSNRAHVRLLLRQFVEAVDDCRKAIQLDPKNIKAYWRAARASSQLDLCRNAIDFCEKGLEQQQNDVDLLKLRDSCTQKLTAIQERRACREVNVDEVLAVQNDVNTWAGQINSLRGVILNKKRDRQLTVLTQEVLQSRAPDKIYNSVGRCFLLDNVQDFEKRQAATMGKIDSELPALERNLGELERRKEAGEKELGEMVMALQKQEEKKRSNSAP